MTVNELITKLRGMAANTKVCIRITSPHFGIEHFEIENVDYQTLPGFGPSPEHIAYLDWTY